MMNLHTDIRKASSGIALVLVVLLSFSSLNCSSNEEEGGLVERTLRKVRDKVKVRDQSKFDFSCGEAEDETFADVVREQGGQLERTILKREAERITPAEQDALGEASHEAIAQEYNLLPQHPNLPQLRRILRELLELRSDPSGIGYNLFVIEADMVNAFTVGGEIYITNKMLEEVTSVDEIAVVLGHEIGHNELGHIAYSMARQRTTNAVFGEEWGATLGQVFGVLTMGFNQRNEFEADFAGIDLAMAAGYNACDGITFWERMQAREQQGEEWMELFRTHPYSSQRIDCFRTHLSEQHGSKCPI